LAYLITGGETPRFDLKGKKKRHARNAKNRSDRGKKHARCYERERKGGREKKGELITIKRGNAIVPASMKRKKGGFSSASF